MRLEPLVLRQKHLPLVQISQPSVGSQFLTVQLRYQQLTLTWQRLLTRSQPQAHCQVLRPYLIVIILSQSCFREQPAQATFSMPQHCQVARSLSCKERLLLWHSLTRAIAWAMHVAQEATQLAQLLTGWLSPPLIIQHIPSQLRHRQAKLYKLITSIWPLTRLNTQELSQLRPWLLLLKSEILLVSSLASFSRQMIVWHM